MAPYECFSASVFLRYSGLKNSKRVLQYMYEAILYIVCSNSVFALV